MRTSKHATVLAAAAATAIGTALCLRSFADCDDDDGDGEPAYSVYLEGRIGSNRDGRFTVGDAKVFVDPDAVWARSADDEEDDGDGYPSPAVLLRRLGRLHRGDAVYVEGSLLPDGSIRAYELYDMEDGTPDPSAQVWSGVVRAVGATSLTIDDDVVEIRGGGDFTTRYDQWADLSGIRVGDAIAVEAGQDVDGRIVGEGGTFRMSGGGSVVAGRIDVVPTDGESEIVVDGVPVVMDGHEDVLGLGRDPCEFGVDDMRVGWTVQARGILRDGKVIADAVRVVSKNEKRARRATRVRGWGYVSAADAGHVVVNGLDVATSRSRAKSARPAAFAAGDRVFVAARRLADGTLVATRLARR